MPYLGLEHAYLLNVLFYKNADFLDEFSVNARNADIFWFSVKMISREDFSFVEDCVFYLVLQSFKQCMWVLLNYQLIDFRQRRAVKK